MKDRWTEEGKWGLPHWLIFFFFLDHTTLCYLQNPTKHFCFSPKAILHWRPAGGHPVGRCFSVAPGHSRALLWPQAETDSRLTLPRSVSHVGICIYHFITPRHIFSTTWLLLLFSQVRSVQRISDWRLSQDSICNIDLLDYSFCVCKWEWGQHYNSAEFRICWQYPPKEGWDPKNECPGYCCYVYR